MNFRDLVDNLFARVKLEIIPKRSRPERYTLPLNRGVASRLLYFKRMLGKVAEIKGDVVECGVGKAKSFQVLALLLEEECKGRKLWGFDSFEGYPETSQEDVSPRNLQKGQWRVMSRDEAYEVLRCTRLSDQFIRDQLEIIAGFFEDTLLKANIKNIALLHLDVNLYKSYKKCLEVLFPKVVPGGVVMFDEYMGEGEEEKCPGAKKAIDEYFRGTPHVISRDPLYGKYYAIKANGVRK